MEKKGKHKKGTSPKITGQSASKFLESLKDLQYADLANELNRNRPSRQRRPTITTPEIKSPTTFDFHGLTVASTTKWITQHILTKYTNQSTSTDNSGIILLTFIVGQGNHSPNRQSKIGPNIERLFKKHTKTFKKVDSLNTPGRLTYKVIKKTRDTLSKKTNKKSTNKTTVEIKSPCKTQKGASWASAVANGKLCSNTTQYKH